jgi:hypothetical protein
LEIAFDSRALRAICESDLQAKAELGANVAEILKHRLADLRAAAYVKDLVAGRPHIVDGSVGHMVVELSNGYCLVFKSNHTSHPMTDADDIDWTRVTRIKILRIERQHA